MTVFEDITSILPFARLEGEAAVDYLTRMTRSMSDISDENWAKLSAPAQNWYNQAAQAVNALQTLPVCEGFAEYVPAEVKAVAPKVKKEKAPKAEKAAKAPKAPKAEKAPKAPKEAKVKQVEVEAPSRGIKRLLIQHPEWNLSEFREAVNDAGMTGVTPSTVATIYSDTRSTLIALKDLGLLPAELIPTPAPIVRVKAVKAEVAEQPVAEQSVTAAVAEQSVTAAVAEEVAPVTE